ncbi:MAG: hypothetical protein WKF74_05660 [Pyrinomonadaceae bacterium]
MTTISNAVPIAARRANECGAALVTMLLVSTLLLAAGGALILTTSMATTNAIDATSEMQAYYAAEAGLEQALNVLRGNVTPATYGAPSSTRINFAKAYAHATSNRSGDTDSTTRPRRLSGWLDYSYQPNNADWRVPITSSYTPLSGLAFSIEVALAPDEDATDPERLLVRSTGFGPKGAQKRLEMTVDKKAFDFAAHAAVMLRSSDDSATAMTTFSVGSSAPHTYTGDDLASPPDTDVPSVPVFAVTNSADGDAGSLVRTGIAADSSNISSASGQLATLNPNSLESWLQTADSARALLSFLSGRAALEGRYFNTNPTDSIADTTPTGLNNSTHSQITFVDGDLDLSGVGGRGNGLLVVTGTLTMGGSSGWDGLVLVLGEGNVGRNGTPDIKGGLVIANFDPTGTGDFNAPSLLSNGGGNSIVGYDSSLIDRALNFAAARVLGVHEF